MVQHVFTITCEGAFSIQNVIRTRHHNNLKTLNFDGVLRVAPKSPKENNDFFKILSKP